MGQRRGNMTGPTRFYRVSTTHQVVKLLNIQGVNIAADHPAQGDDFNRTFQGAFLERAGYP